MSGRWQQGFLRNAKWGTWQPPIVFARLPPQTKVKLSHWLTDGAPSWQIGRCVSCSVGVLSPRPHRPRPPRRKPLWGTVWHKQPQRDRRTALMMGFFYMCHKLWGGQRWDALSVAHWAIFNLKTNKIICAWLTIHNKAGPAAVQTYDDEASIVVNRY